jgi:hypothetical protein
MGRLINRTPTLVALYLAAITTANLLVSMYGPAVVVVNAFLFIRLDLVAKDRLQDAWAGRALWPRMLALIVLGGVISYCLGGDPRISLASCLAFVAAGVADTLAYQTLGGRNWMTRANGSNLAGAAVDSLAFRCWPSAGRSSGAWSWGSSRRSCSAGWCGRWCCVSGQASERKVQRELFHQPW